MIIEYCQNCSHRIDADEFGKGAVRQADGKALCPKCAAAVAPKAPARPGSAIRLPAPQARQAAAARQAKAASSSGKSGVPGGKPNSLPLILGGFGFGFVLVAAALMLFGKSKPASPEPARAASVEAGKKQLPPNDTLVPGRPGTPPDKPPLDNPAPTPTPPVPTNPPVAPPKNAEPDMSDIREGAAARILNDIKDWMRASPDDPWTASDKLNDFIGTYRSTAAGAEAARLLGELRVPKGAGSGALFREYWQGIEGLKVTDLTGCVTYPEFPTGSSTIKDFEAPQNFDENYGQRIRGYVHPPVTGDYAFWIAGDDFCELWLSTDEKPEGKAKVAEVPGYTRFHEWDKYPAQQSKPISLVADKKYYIEALHKEGGSEDSVTVGWKLPNGPLQRPIRGAHLSPLAAEERQMIRDGSFERPAAKQWKFAGNAGIVAGQEAHSGSACCRLNADGNAEQPVQGLQAGRTYILRGWAKTANEEKVSIGVKNHGDKETTASTTQSEYTALTLEFTVGADSTAATVFIVKHGGAQAAFVDDLLLKLKP